MQLETTISSAGQNEDEAKEERSLQKIEEMGSCGHLGANWRP